MMVQTKYILEKADVLIAKGDYEGFLSYCTEDTVWTFIGDQTLIGKEAVREHMTRVYEVPPEFNIESVISESDFVTAVGKITIKNKEGVLTRYAYCDIWRFANNKFAELKAFVIEE